ncbi:MAG: hypothetical protein DHS20C08_04460 [Rhodomicrobium sp.]|nr:MAG: hypothetical protein DHS20C08_04460 [Rhodomicrobium sp.]
MGDVIELGIPTKGPIEPDKVLEAHIGDCSEVLILGYNNEGDFFAASSTGDLKESLWLIETFKAKIIADYLEAE